jgi:hypothetical protein
MSADCFVVFYGLRFDLGSFGEGTVDEEAVRQLNAQEHPLVEAAHQVGLDDWWGNFDLEAQHYMLFIGKKLGIFGWEYASELSLADDELNAVRQAVREQLKQAQIEGEPRLWVQFEPDD